MMQLNELLSPKRCIHAMPVSSKKRLLEKMSEILHEDEPELDEHAAFHSLIEREKLGSTGIGHGIALPHGRLKGLRKAIGAFAILEKGMDYDSIDQEPVRMVFALLVPESATEEHLQLLSQLATILSNENFRERLLHARTDQEIFNHFASQDSG